MIGRAYRKFLRVAGLNTSPSSRDTPVEAEVVLPSTPEQQRSVEASRTPFPRSLGALAELYGSDKGSSKHEYTKLYELLFHAFRNEPVKLVEMGLLIGGPEHGASADRPTSDLPSVRMWLDYFPNAEIVGSDISDFSWFQHDRFNFVRCDMSQRKNFGELRTAASGAKVIIDDASHASAHQQFGLLELFPVLADGGIYIIEDLQWQPEVYERDHSSFPKTSELLRGYLSNRFFSHADHEIEADLNRVAASFSSVLLFQDAYSPDRRDKVAVIHKAPS